MSVFLRCGRCGHRGRMLHPSRRGRSAHGRHRRPGEHPIIVTLLGMRCRMIASCSYLPSCYIVGEFNIVPIGMVPTLSFGGLFLVGMWRTCHSDVNDVSLSTAHPTRYKVEYDQRHERAHVLFHVTEPYSGFGCAVVWYCASLPMQKLIF